MRVDPDAEQRWSTYLLSVLGFSLASVLVLFGLGRLQDQLPLDIGMAAVDPAGAWNTAVSFVTNTNWQWYSGEVDRRATCSRWPAWRCRTSCPRRSAWRSSSRSIRGFARPRTDRRRQLLGRT